MYGMPILQIIFEFLEDLEAPKEDTDKPSPNAVMAASKINFFISNDFL